MCLTSFWSFSELDYICVCNFGCVWIAMFCRVWANQITHLDYRIWVVDNTKKVGNLVPYIRLSLGQQESNFVSIHSVIITYDSACWLCYVQWFAKDHSGDCTAPVLILSNGSVCVEWRRIPEAKTNKWRIDPSDWSKHMEHQEQQRTLLR